MLMRNARNARRVDEGHPASRASGFLVVKLFSYSTQLCMKIILLMNFKMSIVDILTLMSRINASSVGNIYFSVF